MSGAAPETEQRLSRMQMMENELKAILQAEQPFLDPAKQELSSVKLSPRGEELIKDMVMIANAKLLAEHQQSSPHEPMVTGACREDVLTALANGESYAKRWEGRPLDTYHTG